MKMKSSIRAEQTFADANKKFWDLMNQDIIIRGSSNYTLIRIENHPISILCNASLGAIISHYRGTRLLFLVRTKTNRLIQLLKSYPQANFVFLNEIHYRIANRWAVFQAEKVYNAIKKLQPSELLDFEIDGIRFGDVVYDGVLAQGFATIHKIDRRVVPILQDIYFNRYVVRDLLHRYNIESAVFSHTIGTEGAPLSRYFLKYGVEVIAKLGGYQYVIKKYQKINNMCDYAGKPEYKYYERAIEKNDGFFLEEIETYLGNRFGQRVNHPAVDVAFDTTKKLYNDKNAFCETYGLDKTKPIAFVMLHAFNDYPHSHFKRKMIFSDYYHWFMKTLQYAKQDKSVNWIFKQHPVEEKFYKTKDLNLREKFQEVTNHIRLFKSDEDFNARSIPFLADVLITCIGTAGLEYAACGIPCILAGESPYNGFGFTIEPQDESSYINQLSRISDIPKLDGRQVKSAKIIAYLYFCAIMGSRYHFCPYFNHNQVFGWNDDSEYRLWHEAAKLLTNKESQEMIKDQISDIGKFLKDPNWTQYIDRKEFHF